MKQSSMIDYLCPYCGHELELQVDYDYEKDCEVGNQELPSVRFRAGEEVRDYCPHCEREFDIDIDINIAVHPLDCDEVDEFFYSSCYRKSDKGSSLTYRELEVKYKRLSRECEALREENEGLKELAEDLANDLQDARDALIDLKQDIHNLVR